MSRHEGLPHVRIGTTKGWLDCPEIDGVPLKTVTRVAIDAKPFGPAEVTVTFDADIEFDGTAAVRYRPLWRSILDRIRWSLT